MFGNTIVDCIYVWKFCFILQYKHYTMGESLVRECIALDTDRLTCMDDRGFNSPLSDFLRTHHALNILSSLNGQWAIIVTSWIVAVYHNK